MPLQRKTARQHARWIVLLFCVFVSISWCAPNSFSPTTNRTAALATAKMTASSSGAAATSESAAATVPLSLPTESSAGVDTTFLAPQQRRHAVVLVWPNVNLQSGLPVHGLPELRRALQHSLHVAIVSKSPTLRALFMVVCTASTRTREPSMLQPRRQCLAVISDDDDRLVGRASPFAISPRVHIATTTASAAAASSPPPMSSRRCHALLSTSRENAASFDSMRLADVVQVPVVSPPPPLPLHVIVTLGNCPISGQRASVDTERRVETAVRLYRERVRRRNGNDAGAAADADGDGDGCTLLFWSGGRVYIGGDKPISEAQMMAALAVVLHDVPPHVMELEDASMSTVANKQNTALMLRRGYPWRRMRDATTFTLVAKGKHLDWAVRIFNKSTVFAQRLSTLASPAVKDELLTQMCGVYATLLVEQRACCSKCDMVPALPAVCEERDSGDGSTSMPQPPQQHGQQSERNGCLAVDTNDNSDVLMLLSERIGNVYNDRPGLD